MPLYNLRHFPPTATVTVNDIPSTVRFMVLVYQRVPAEVIDSGEPRGRIIRELLLAGIGGGI
jgi:hypothetical protein